MTKIERYNAELKGCKFIYYKDTNYSRNRYTFGDILENGHIDIYFYAGDNIQHSTTFTISNAFDNIKNGYWVIDINYIRKKKLEKLMKKCTP